jgi:hypothetical protein
VDGRAKPGHDTIIKPADDAVIEAAHDAVRRPRCATRHPTNPCFGPPP